MQDGFSPKVELGIPKARKRAPGGGRKPDGELPKLKITVSLSPHVVEQVKHTAAEQNKSVSELVEKALEDSVVSLPDLSQPAVKHPLTRLLDLLAGWERFADQNDTPDAPSVIDNIADLYQEAGNLDVRRENNALGEGILCVFLTDRVLPVLMKQE